MSRDSRETCGLGLAIALRNPWLVPTALVSGYGLAWIGHFGFEKNRPATFKHPLKSFVSDWRLLYVTLTFQADRELERLGVSPERSRELREPVAADP